MTSSFNFNLISHRDLRKFLTRKMEIEKWEFASAFDATLAHYTYQPQISYGFPHSKNMKIISKKLLHELELGFIMPFLTFGKDNMNRVFEENSSFLEDGVYYFRNAEGKKELYNYPVKTFEHIQKIVNSKYKKSSSDTQFILEKSMKKPFIFSGNQFETRVYVLLIRVGKKYHSFMYPSIFFNFGIDNIDKQGFLNALGINEEITSTNQLIKDIYKLVQKTALVISNYLSVTNRVYSVESDIKNISKKDIDFFQSEFQFNLYGIDITIDENLKPFLIDIVYNPIFGLIDIPSKVAKEKSKIYNDVIENFVVFYKNNKRINLDSSNFVLLYDTIPYQEYKCFVSKKIFDETSDSKYDDSLEYSSDIKDFITPQGEQLVEHILFENKDNLANDNLILGNRMGLKPINSDEFINSDYLFTSVTGGISEEYTMQNSLIDYMKKKEDNFEKCYFESFITEEQKNVSKVKTATEAEDEQIQKKIKDLLNKEKSNKMLNVAKNTIPVLGLLFAIKKGYSIIKERNEKITQVTPVVQTPSVLIPIKKEERFDNSNKKPLTSSHKPIDLSIRI